MDIAIVGAGAAGCFAAVEIKRRMPHSRVTVYERGKRPLAKVAITGGGRCNLTNSFEGIPSVETAYPRGARLMKRLLKEFSHKDAFEWFENAGVKLTIQEDNCVFPVSQDAMEIVNTLLSLMHKHGVMIRTQQKVTKIATGGNEGYDVFTIDKEGKTNTESYNVVVVTTGGSPKISGLDMIQDLGFDIVTPVPSLFSLCLKNNPITELTGTVVENVTSSIVGTKIKAEGPLLITHWGLSGPSILKLSSYGARYLQECDYKTNIAINWFHKDNEASVCEQLTSLALNNQHKQLQNVYPQRFNSRLWSYLLHCSGLNPMLRWAELGRKGQNKLVATLTNQHFVIDGKNRFKEEFVTCGGVALGNINPSTLESKKYPGLYFAGEVLDVDAITGGFNLQAAWTMAFVVAKSCIK